MPIYSTYWYRVADIKPRLRSHVRLYRHSYRGQNWYVLQDSSSGRQHRFNKTAYSVIGLMNGKRTVDEIWKNVSAALADKAPTQDEVIRLLAQLHGVDALQSDIAPDTLDIFDRQDKQRSKWKQRLMNPFALRFPLFDPDRFLGRWIFLIKPLASHAGTLLWLLVVGSAAVLAALNWPEMTRNMADRILTPKNLFLLWLVYPVIKLFHELGHAFAIKIWGGEVHEMGIMLLAFTPIPYVEASASGAFPDKRKRMAVAAAGMAVELFVAALALFIWLNVESGRVSAVAYNVMLIGGVSTLLFNGNPLLRFDGYYILADWIEIPNLAGRSTRYLGYLFKRYLLGMEDAVSPVTAPGEEKWFVGYGIAAFFYRLLVLTALVLFISGKFFFIGILIAVWALCTQIILPLVRNSCTLCNSIDARRNRTRFIMASSSVAILLMVLLFWIPLPLRTSVEGVVTMPEHSRIRAGTDCFISEIIVSDQTGVQKGDSLLHCEDPFLKAEALVLEASLKESRARYDAEPLQSRVQREILKQEIVSAKADLKRVHERLRELTIKSFDQGIFVLPEASSLPGRFVKQGDTLGYIIGTSEAKVIVVVGQADISLVREQTKRVELRLASQVDKSFMTVIDREIPAASDRLPSPVLGTTGGGEIPVDPSDPNGVRTLAETFQFEIRLPLPKDDIRIGERVYAVFDHGYEPLARQWYRRIRQLFLRRFHL